MEGMGGRRRALGGLLPEEPPTGYTSCCGPEAVLEVLRGVAGELPAGSSERWDRPMANELPTVVGRYADGVSTAYRASLKYLNDNPDIGETFEYLENFAALSVWPCVPTQTGRPLPASDEKPQGPIIDFEDDLQHALFYAACGLYQDAKDRLMRFFRYAIWRAAVTRGPQLEKRCCPTVSLNTLLAERQFRKYDAALSIRSRLKQWLVVMAEHEAVVATSCVYFYPSSCRKFVVCAHEAVDLAVACLAYRKPQVAVAIDGAEKFGDYVLWAELLEPDHVQAVLGVLKPRTKEFLLARAEKDVRIAAMCDYLKDLTPVTSEQEFFPRYSEMLEFVSRMVGLKDS